MTFHKKEYKPYKKWITIIKKYIRFNYKCYRWWIIEHNCPFWHRNPSAKLCFASTVLYLVKSHLDCTSLKKSRILYLEEKEEEDVGGMFFGGGLSTLDPPLTRVKYWTSAKGKAKVKNWIYPVSCSLGIKNTFVEPITYGETMEYYLGEIKSEDKEYIESECHTFDDKIHEKNRNVEYTEYLYENNGLTIEEYNDSIIT